VLKLRRNRRSAYTERPTPHLVEEEPTLLNTYMSRREQKSWSWISRRLKPIITVLTRASSNLTERPIDQPTTSQSPGLYPNPCLRDCVQCFNPFCTKSGGKFLRPHIWSSFKKIKKAYEIMVLCVCISVYSPYQLLNA
jgi:hypothetical protein